MNTQVYQDLVVGQGSGIPAGFLPDLQSSTPPPLRPRPAAVAGTSSGGQGFMQTMLDSGARDLTSKAEC